MKALIRVLAVIAGVTVLIFVLLAAYLALVFDPNDYRDELAQQVKSRTGRDLVISGDIGLSVFPWLGFEVGEASLGNAPGFGDEPFARVQAGEARVKLMPLLRKEVEVDRILLKGLDLRLVRARDGTTNWEDLAGPTERPEPERAPAERDGRRAVEGMAALAIGGVEVESARVLWDDRQTGVRHEVQNLNLKTGRILPGESFPLELGMDLRSSEPPVEGRFELNGVVLARPQEDRYTVDDLEARFNGRGAGLPGRATDLRVATRLDLDLARETMVLDKLRVAAYGVEARGALQGSAILGEGRYKGAIEVGEFNPRELLRALGASLETADQSVLRRASFKATLDAEGQRVMLDGLEIRIDDSMLAGSAGLADLARQAIRFDLKLDAIDLDRYLPPRKEGATGPVGTPGAAAAAAAEPEALRKLDLEGRLRIGRVKASGLQVSDIDLNARAAGGITRLQPVTAALYQGRYTGNISLDARGRQLRVSVDEALSGVQIGPLLRDLTGKEEKLTGQADLRARLQATGADADALTRTLAGNAELRFANGALKGVNIAQLLREAEARLRGEPVPPADGPLQTDFTELGGTFQIADGVARNRDLDAKSPLLRVTGAGSFDLPRERIDYLLRVNVVGTLTGQGGRELERLRGVQVPVRVGGSFAQPTYALDVETLLAENVKGQVRQRLEEELGKRLDRKVDPKLEEKLRKGLDGLFR